MLHQPPTLLITDDDRAIRETLREVFEPQGFHTVLAADGQQAVEIIQSESIHVAVVDFHMPKLTGLEVVHRLREFEVQVPCILISAALDEAIVREALEAEVFSVERKPLSLSQIRGLVNRAMRQTYDWPPEN